MERDRFDQFYMMQTQAKGLETKGAKHAALDLYVEIIEDYFPDTDYSFQRAVVLLIEYGKVERAKEYCKLAIERIENAEMKGNCAFFERQLLQLDANKAKNKSNERKFLNKKALLTIAVIASSALLSLPNKIYKFIFLIFLAIIGWLIIEIIKRYRRKISIRPQSVALCVTALIAVGAASQIPPPQWTSFFSLAPLSQIAGDQSSSKNDSASGEAAKRESVAISADDLSDIKKITLDTLLVKDYDISVDGNTLLLQIKAKQTASKTALKNYAVRILSELNDYKNQKSHEDRLGDLYKDYTASIICTDMTGKVILRGQSNPYTLKIDWQ